MRARARSRSQNQAGVRVSLILLILAVSPLVMELKLEKLAFMTLGEALASVLVAISSGDSVSGSSVHPARCWMSFAQNTK